MNQETRQKRLAKALEQAVALNPFAYITDPVAWQREERQDRSLPRRSGNNEHDEWTNAEFSTMAMSQAMRGMEDEPPLYTVDDLKENWQ